MTRARHERQIELNDSGFGQEFVSAAVAVAHRSGLAFWTDEQIAEIREEMIRQAWRSHQTLRRCRRSIKRWNERRSAA